MSFAAPIFLLTAVAAAIPVLLHMINRQRAKNLPFSTLRFLQLSLQKTRRRKRVHDILLMVLRAAVLLLIAVGLAKPAVSSLSSLWGGANSAAAIILDNSASMGTIDQDRPRFDTASAAALQILDELKDGDETALLITGGPPYPELGKFFRTQEQIRQLLAQAHVSYQRADLAYQVQQARALLAKSSASHKQIYVITDMQKVSWENWKANPQLPSPFGKGTQRVPGGEGRNDIKKSGEYTGANISPSDRRETAVEDDQTFKIPVILIDCNRAQSPTWPCKAWNWKPRRP